MNIADELLKLKQLLDANAITQEEYDRMKAKIINRDEANTKSTNSYTSNAETRSSYGSSTNNYNSVNNSYRNTYNNRYRNYRLFNDKPFKILGFICFGITMLFVFLIFLLLVQKSFEAAYYMTWECSFIPAVAALTMGIILKIKTDSKVLLILGIVSLVLSFIMSIAATSSYYTYIEEMIGSYF